MGRIADRITAAGHVAKLPAVKSAAPAVYSGLINGNPGISGDYAAHAMAIGQAEHFRGHVFSAVNAIGKRAMALELKVARYSLGAGRKKHGIANKFGRDSRVFNKLPAFVKSLGENNLEIVERHPVVDTIRYPNELMSCSQLWYVTAVTMTVVGRCYWLMDYSPDGSTEILPVPATWVKPVFNDSSDSDSYCDYKVKPPGAQGEPIDIPGDQMVMFYYPDPFDPFGAISQLQMQAQTVLADEAIARTQWLNFRQGLNPGMAVVLGDQIVTNAEGGTEKQRPRLDPAKRARMLAYIRNELQGLEKTGSPVILDRLIADIKKISVSPSEMDYVNSSKQTKANLYEGFGVNPIVTGQVENSNRASAAVAGQLFDSSTMNPLATLIGETLTVKVLPRFSMAGKYVAWFDPLETDDPEMSLRRWQMAISSDSVTRNEIRQHVIGLPPEDGMDNTPGEHKQKIAPKPVFVPPGKGQKSFSLGRKAKAEFSKRWLKAHSSAESKMASAIQPPLSEIADVASEAVRTATTVSESKMRQVVKAAVEDSGIWKRFLKESMPKMLRREMVAGVDQELSLARTAVVQAKKSHGLRKSEDDLISEFQLDMPEHYLQQIELQIEEILNRDFWSDIPDSEIETVMEKFRQGVADGLSNEQISAEIASGSSAFTRVQARAIARTESTNVLNAGHQVVRENLMAAGLVTGSEWFTVGDEDVRPTHQNMNGVVIQKGESFQVGNGVALYPGHIDLPVGERVNCRCTTLAVYNLDAL